MKIGIRAHDVGCFDTATLAKEVFDLGFDGVQLVFKKALNYQVDFNELGAIKKAFAGGKIFMLGAYFNPVHPNSEIISEGFRYFVKHLEIAKKLGCLYVGTETGSLMGSPWNYVPENHSDESLDKVVTIFKKLCLIAEVNDCYVAVEGAYAHVCYSPLRVKQLVKAVNSPYLKVTVDLFNFLNIDNYQERLAILDRSINLLKDRIVIFHLKDFIVKDSKLVQVGLGEGLMEFDVIIPLIQQKLPNALLIFEGVTGQSIVPSLKLIKKLITEGNKQ